MLGVLPGAEYRSEAGSKGNFRVTVIRSPSAFRLNLAEL